MYFRLRHLSATSFAVFSLLSVEHAVYYSLSVFRVIFLLTFICGSGTEKKAASKRAYSTVEYGSERGSFTTMHGWP